MSTIISLLCSALVGYLAGQIMKLEGAWYIYLLLGLAGGFVGNLLFGIIGFYADGLLANIIVDVVGACIVIFLYRKLKI